MVTKKMIAMLITGVVSGGPFAAAQSGQTKGGRTDIPLDHVIVGHRAVGMPQGVFLLVRKGKELGAIKFSNIEAGEVPLMGKATYESFFQGDGSGSFQSSTVVRQSGEVSTKPLTGIGRMSFGGGKRKIRVGKWSFAYHFPAWVSMYPYGEVERDYGFEFAPTSAREVAEIDASDKRLKWFRYDSNTSTTLQLTDLAK